MGVLAWIATGFIAGLLAQLITGTRRRGCITTILIGVIGGVIGGAVTTAIGEEGLDEFGWRSILVAFFGAAVLLLVLQALGGGRRGRRR